MAGLAPLTCFAFSLRRNKLLTQRVVSPLLYRLSYLAFEG
jgi:hypothetical protein